MQKGKKLKCKKELKCMKENKKRNAKGATSSLCNEISLSLESGLAIGME